jgi:hypothetical protein
VKGTIIIAAKKSVRGFTVQGALPVPAETCGLGRKFPPGGGTPRGPARFQGRRGIHGCTQGRIEKAHGRPQTHRAGAEGRASPHAPQMVRPRHPESDALDLREGVFKLDDPRKIAASLKRSAERSRRRKADPYRSALSMLVFYINRAGKTLPARRKAILEQAKEELRAQFGRPPPKR